MAYTVNINQSFLNIVSFTGDKQKQHYQTVKIFDFAARSARKVLYNNLISFLGQRVFHNYSFVEELPVKQWHTTK